MKIWYSNPYSTSLNIGGAYNAFIKQLNPNEDDWIVLQDGDIMFLTPDWGKRIESALALDGDKFGLVGCYTNMLMNTHQLHEKRHNKDRDIFNHYQIALQYDQQGIEEYKGIVAGFFMAFQYKTWKSVGGFIEKNIACDTIFNQMVKDKGLKVGLIRSLYVFHLYRIWAEKEPWNERKHLMK